MGKKANVNFRYVNKTKTWNSNWYSDLINYGYIFKKDYFIYIYFQSLKELKQNLELCCFRIIRTSSNTIIELVLAKKLKNPFDFDLNKKFLTSEFKWSLLLNIGRLFFSESNLKVFSKQKVKFSSKYVALIVAKLIEKRMKFKGSLIQRFLIKISQKLKGLQIKCKGRINNVDRAATEQITFGSTPMQSFNVELDYGFAIANTQKGLQSIKVWICKNL